MGATRRPSSEAFEPGRGRLIVIRPACSFGLGHVSVADARRVPDVARRLPGAYCARTARSEPSRALDYKMSHRPFSIDEAGDEDADSARFPRGVGAQFEAVVTAAASKRRPVKKSARRKCLTALPCVDNEV